MTEAVAVPIPEELVNVIDQKTYHTIRGLSITVNSQDKTITIEGRTTSYYNKQMAQNGVLREYAEHYQVINSIEVD